ncbi:MAG: hypothetical protein ACP5GO_03120 [Thermoprotei archaeon]
MPGEVLLSAGLSPYVISGLYVAAGIVPIIIYFVEIHRKSKLQLSRVDELGSSEPAQGKVQLSKEGIIEGLGELKKEIKGEKEVRGEGVAMFTVSAQGNYVTMSASIPQADELPEGVTLEQSIGSESSQLSTVLEGGVIATMDDGSPSFIIRAKATRDRA